MTSDGRPGDGRPGDGIPAGGGRPGDGGIPAADSLASLADLDGLRELVREVLRELIPPTAGLPGPGNVMDVASGQSGVVERHIQPVTGTGPAESGVASGSDTAGASWVAGGSRVASAGRVVGAGPGTESSAGGPASPGGIVRAVRLTTDEELRAFVAEVLRLAGDPQRRQDLLSGRLSFTLGGRPPLGQLPGGQPPGGQFAAGVPAAVRRIEKGAVTERAVIAAAKAGNRLVLGPGAMLTPLAKDKARALGVPVEKER
jgi:hypothetical protein